MYEIFKLQIVNTDGIYLLKIGCINTGRLPAMATMTVATSSAPEHYGRDIGSGIGSCLTKRLNMVTTLSIT